MKSLEYYLNLSKNNNKSSQTSPFCQIYKEHFVQSVAAFKFIARLRIPGDEIMSTIQVKLAELSSRNTSKLQQFEVTLTVLESRTLIFDMDETLIHVNTKLEGAAFKIPIKNKDGETNKVSYFYSLHFKLTSDSQEFIIDPL